MRLIAPPALVGRDQELLWLRTFCLQPDRNAYAWLRGPPWAGKSALMAWFVLHPPDEVTVVSFFVSSRWGHHDSAAAFADILIEQLAEVLGEAVPDYLTSAVRYQCFLDLLRRAAQRCSDRGGRLLLVVDGLDEENGHPQSIASLLPVDPPHGLRIIVTGRPTMHLSASVASEHPLVDTGTHHDLTPSPQAGEARDHMRRELRHLLLRRGIEQDLLGLLVAAGGGLGDRELAELIGVREWEIEEHMAAGVERLLLPGSNHWAPHGAPPVYAFGHKDLKYEAEQHIGEARLMHYRQQIYRWADGYRERGWPADTPEYLFGGYFRLLQHSEDTTGMIALALDNDRHDRMRDLTGGDIAGIMEVADAQDQALLSDEPDLRALARLAVHHETLATRTPEVPASLPAVWVLLGRPARAEALARSATDADRRTQAIEAAAVAAASIGDVTSAESLASSGCRDRALGDVSQMIARFDAGRARAVAASIANPTERARALSLIVREIATTDCRQAVEVACTITEPYASARALTAVALTMIKAGSRRHALGLINSARRKTESLPDQLRPGRALTAIVWAQIAAGEFEQARSTADALDRRVSRIRSPSQRARLSASAAAAMHAVGRPERYAPLLDSAIEIVNGVVDDQQRVALLLALAKSVASVEPDRTQALLAEAGDIACNANPTQRVALLLSVAQASSEPYRRTELHDQAEAEARAAADDAERATQLSAVALAVAAEEPDRAGSLARQAEDILRGLHRPSLDPATWFIVVRAAAVAGVADVAESVARGALTGVLSASALLAIAETVGENDPDLTRRLLANATTRAGQISRRHRRAETLLAVAQAKASVGDVGGAMALLERVERTLLHVSRPDHASELGEAVARTRAAIDPTTPDAAGHGHSVPSGPRFGEFIRTVAAVAAHVDAGLAEMLAYTAATPYARARALLAVAGQVHHTEHVQALVEQADIEAADVTSRREWSEFCGAAARIVHAYDPDRARGLLDQAEASGRSVASASRRGQALEAAVRAAVALGDRDRARAIAGSIERKDNRERAMRLAEATPEEVPVGVAPPLQLIAQDFADAGDNFRAEVVAQFIADPATREATLGRVTGFTAARAAPSRAAVGVSPRGAPGLQAQVDVAAAVAVGVVKAEDGDVDAAERAVLTITDYDLRMQALHQVITTVAEAGIYSRAQQLTHHLSADKRDGAHATVARIAAKRGDPDWVAALAELIGDPALLAEVLIEAASTVGGSHARILLARAVRVNGWRNALVPIAAVDPEAALDAIGEIRRAFTST